MNSKGDLKFQERQLLDAEHLASLVKDHPLMGPQMQSHVEDIKSEISNSKKAPLDVRTVLLFYGKPVQGSNSVDAKFSADFLKPYLEAVKTSYALKTHGVVGERGPRKNEADARLMICGTPRGSFGFELVAPPSEDLFAAEHLAASLREIALTIDATADSDDAYLERLDQISERVFGRLQELFKVLKESEAGLRVQTGDLDISIRPEVAVQAYDRITRSEEREARINVTGIFRGATLDSWRFDFKTPEETISGRLGSDLQEADVMKMILLTSQECSAELLQLTVVTPSGTMKRRYQLVGLNPT